MQKRYKNFLDHMYRAEWQAIPVPQELPEKARDLVAELLVAMAEDLRFKYNHTHLKEMAYSPKAMFLREEVALESLQGLVKVLRGEQAIPVEVHEQPSPPKLEKVFMK